jgi:hypothetical protein
LIQTPVDPRFEKQINDFKEILATDFGFRSDHWASYIVVSRLVCDPPSGISNLWDQGVEERWSRSEALLELGIWIESVKTFIKLELPGFSFATSEELKQVVWAGMVAGYCEHVLGNFENLPG